MNVEKKLLVTVFLFILISVSVEASLAVNVLRTEYNVAPGRTIGLQFSVDNVLPVKVEISKEGDLADATQLSKSTLILANKLDSNRYKERFIAYIQIPEDAEYGSVHKLELSFEEQLYEEESLDSVAGASILSRPVVGLKFNVVEPTEEDNDEAFVAMFVDEIPLAQQPSEGDIDAELKIAREQAEIAEGLRESPAEPSSATGLVTATQVNDAEDLSLFVLIGGIGLFGLLALGLVFAVILFVIWRKIT